LAISVLKPWMPQLQSVEQEFLKMKNTSANISEILSYYMDLWQIWVSADICRSKWKRNALLAAMSNFNDFNIN
jgi:hypothetical protein